MIVLIHGFVDSSLPIGGPFQMHVVKENESIVGGIDVLGELGNGYTVDVFMLTIADRILTMIEFDAVVVETEGLGSDVEGRWQLREETISEKRLA
jgi:hypothetical protein